MTNRKLFSVLASFSSSVLFGCGTIHAFQLPRHNGVANARTSSSIGGGAMSSTTMSSTTTTTTTSSSSLSSPTALGMAPRYDTATKKWFMTDPETEGPSAGYGIIGSLYRAGPVPFIQRIVNADTYEQAVLKYMAREGCDRIEAQGNMDAFLENPQDWGYQKMDEKRGRPKKDYANANMDPKQIILSTVWACVVVVFFYDAITGTIEGRYGKTDGTDLLHGNLWTLPF